MCPIGLTIKRCSTDCRATELRRFDKLLIQNIKYIHIKEHTFKFFLSDKRVRVRDGDVHVDDGCWRQNVLVAI